MKKGVALLLCVVMMTMLTFTVAAKNGAPSGAHFNLNLISVEHEKDMVDSYGGRVIFVLQGNDTEITMRKTNEFNFTVLDKDGTDGEAMFQIPVPGTEVLDEIVIDELGNTELVPTGYAIDNYLLYARPLGKPSDTLEELEASLNLIGADIDEIRLIELIEEEISLVYPLGYTFDISIDSVSVEIGEQLNFTRKKGQSKFQNITDQMMFITVTAQADIIVYDEEGIIFETLLDQQFTFDDVSVFDFIFEDVFWKYDNKGLKLLQLRFYYSTEPMKKNNGKVK